MVARIHFQVVGDVDGLRWATRDQGTRLRLAHGVSEYRRIFRASEAYTDYVIARRVAMHRTLVPRAKSWPSLCVSVGEAISCATPPAKGMSHRTSRPSSKPSPSRRGGASAESELGVALDAAVIGDVHAVLHASPLAHHLLALDHGI